MDILHNQLAVVQRQLAFVATDSIDWKFYVQIFSWGVCLFESYLVYVCSISPFSSRILNIWIPDFVNTRCTRRLLLQKFFPPISMRMHSKSLNCMAKTKQNSLSSLAYTNRPLILSYSISASMLGHGALLASL